MNEIITQETVYPERGGRQVELAGGTKQAPTVSVQQVEMQFHTSRTQRNAGVVTVGRTEMVVWQVSETNSRM